MDFYRSIPLEADALEAFYLESKTKPDMIEQYRIKVHSMKSSANLIGATMLGGMAKLLENAARDGDIEVLDALHSIFIREWRSYSEKLKECVGAGAEEKEDINKKEKAEDATIILAYLEMLRNALEELDIDAMDGAMEKLEQFWYPPEIQSDIEKLGAIVINMDSDQAALLIEKLMSQISVLAKN